MLIFVSWVNDYWVQSSVWNSTIFRQRAERHYFWESVVSSNNGSWSHYFSECVVHVPFLKPLRESVRAVPSLFLSRSLYLLPFAGSQQVLRHGLWSSARLIQSALISTSSFSALQSRDETLYIVYSRLLVDSVHWGRDGEVMIIRANTNREQCNSPCKLNSALLQGNHLWNT